MPSDDYDAPVDGEVVLKRLSRYQHTAEPVSANQQARELVEWLTRCLVVAVESGPAWDSLRDQLEGRIECYG